MVRLPECHSGLGQSLALLTMLLVLLVAGCVEDGPAPADTPPADFDQGTPTPAQTGEPPRLTSPAVEEQVTRAADGMMLVHVPGGTYEMGSDADEIDHAMYLCSEYGLGCSRSWFTGEMPVHMVILGDYWIDQTEVSNAQYNRCVEDGVCLNPTCPDEPGLWEADMPVVCVSWEQAAVYCKWVGGRLPTEAEWENAARGLHRWRYPWGDEFDGTRLNYCDASCEHAKRDELFDDGSTRSAAVGSYPGGASWVGALDMVGNVWEWVGDWFGAYPDTQQVNPTGPDSGSRKVLRGGSWNASRDHVRAAIRSHAAPDATIPHAGFRCVSVLP